MEHIVSIINSALWPLVTLIIFFQIKEPLRSMIPLVKNLKYKDLEVNFKEELDEIRSEVQQSGVLISPSPEEKEEIKQLLKASPSSIILKSWEEIELAAKNKVVQIRSITKNDKTKLKPLSYLEYTGALIPSTTRAIRKLRYWADLATNTNDIDLSQESLEGYVTLAKTIAKQINGITEVPKQKLIVLTQLVVQFNHLIDTGKYDYITIDDIHHQIEERNIIDYLNNETGNDSDFSMFLVEGWYKEYLTYYYEQIEMICAAYSGREAKWGIENKGLCLLVAWTNEVIQQGSGWYPSE